MKHENIFHDRNEGIPNSIMRCNPFPIMGTKKNGGSLLDIKVNHKCNESTQELKDGGGPT